jgi:hypothetical protein
MILRITSEALKGAKQNSIGEGKAASLKVRENRRQKGSLCYD